MILVPDITREPTSTGTAVSARSGLSKAVAVTAPSNRDDHRGRDRNSQDTDITAVAHGGAEYALPVRATGCRKHARRSLADVGHGRQEFIPEPRRPN